MSAATSCYTLTPGFVLKYDVDYQYITTHLIVRVCTQLEKSFGEGYSFVPEAITEGGILMLSWPGCTKGQYKSIRFHRYRGTGSWPWLAHASDLIKNRHSWATKDAVIIWSADTGPYANGRKSQRLVLQTYLKAMYGAPCWTKAEVRKLADAFESEGFTCTRVKSVKQLKKVDPHGRLTTPRDR